MRELVCLGERVFNTRIIQAHPSSGGSTGGLFIGKRLQKKDTVISDISTNPRCSSFWCIENWSPPFGICGSKASTTCLLPSKLSGISSEGGEFLPIFRFSYWASLPTIHNYSISPGLNLAMLSLSTLLWEGISLPSYWTFKVSPSKQDCNIFLGWQVVVVPKEGGSKKSTHLSPWELAPQLVGFVVIDGFYGALVNDDLESCRKDLLSERKQRFSVESKSLSPNLFPWTHQPSMYFLLWQPTKQVFIFFDESTC